MKLDELVERLKQDIAGIPWGDRNINGRRLHSGVVYFIDAFVADVKKLNELEENKDA